MYGTQGFGTASDDLYVPYEKKNCYALRRLFPQQILASRGFYIYLPVSKTNFTGDSAKIFAEAICLFAVAKCVATAI